MQFFEREYLRTQFRVRLSEQKRKFICSFFEREYLNLNYELSELKLEVKKEVKLEVKMEVKKDECIRVKKDECIRVVDFNLQKYRP